MGVGPGVHLGLIIEKRTHQGRTVNILIVMAHPEPTSFNAALTAHAVKQLSEAGHNVDVSDLYADNFNPVAGRHDFSTVADAARFHYQAEQSHAAQTGGFSEELAREQAKVLAADLLVLQFPLWWGGPPAILKGWLERVLAYGFAYVDGRRYETGLFKGKRAFLSVTTGGTEQRFGEDGPYGELEKVLWQPQHLTLEYMGYTVEEPFMSYAAPRVDDAQRQTYLEKYAKKLLSLAALPATWTRDEQALEAAGENAWAKKK